jgi:hypothetical protein
MSAAGKRFSSTNAAAVFSSGGQPFTAPSGVADQSKARTLRAISLSPCGQSLLVSACTQSQMPNFKFG